MIKPVVARMVLQHYRHWPGRMLLGSSEWRAGVVPDILPSTGQPMTKDCLDQNVSHGEVKKRWIKLTSEL